MGPTCDPDPLCDQHLKRDQMGRTECIRSWRAILCGWPQLGCHWTRCQPGHHNTWNMYSNDHQVGNLMSATVQHCTCKGSIFHAQLKPQETPPANTDSKVKSLKHVHKIQHTGNSLARHLRGCTSTVQGVAQLMHEVSQGSWWYNPNTDQDIRQCSSQCKGSWCGIHQSGRTIWEWALVGSQR